MGTVYAVELRGEEETARLASKLVPLLQSGDCILLSGPIGAGKSSFARALIHSKMASEGWTEDVPSPTYTLVQTYGFSDYDIWHADLYRLSDVSELEELGLDSAFETAVSLVEWPDRLGTAPKNALWVDILPTEDGAARTLTFRSEAKRWSGLAGTLGSDPAEPPETDRIAQFLRGTPWSAAEVTRIFGDASSRRYLRLANGDETAILMDAPNETSGSTVRFVRIAGHLARAGLHVPDILAEDAANGLLLLSDFGDTLFPAEIRRDPASERMLYETAVDVLVQMQREPRPEGLARMTADQMVRQITEVIPWYRDAVAPTTTTDLPDFREVADAPLRALEAQPMVFVHRDYHAENLFWHEKNVGVRRVGVIDFQDALLGHPAYDLVSLVFDARRDTPVDIPKAAINRFSEATGMEQSQLAKDIASLTVQRQLRILGDFARLAIRENKPGYLDLMPRVWGHMAQALEAPHLSKLKTWVQSALPPPDAHHLEKLALGQCVR